MTKSEFKRFVKDRNLSLHYVALKLGVNYSSFKVWLGGQRKVFDDGTETILKAQIEAWVNEIEFAESLLYARALPMFNECPPIISIQVLKRLQSDIIHEMPKL